MTPTLRLTEWQTSAPLPLSGAQRAGLEQHFQARIVSGPTPDTFTVTPTNIVGTLTLDGTTVIVAPKIAIDRVLFMVSYALDALRWKDVWSQLAGVTDLVDGMAGLFVQTCDRVLAQGLYRSYRTLDNDQATVRGRIRWQRQARRPAPLPIAVRYHVHDDDVLENQLVRAALAVLRTMPIRDTTVAAGIARHWRGFKDLAVLTHPRHQGARVAWTRQNEHYRPLIGLARIIIEATMTELDDGEAPVPGFTVEMPRVFEQFVRTALRERSGYTPNEFPDNPGQHGLRLDTARRVGLLPDLGVQADGRWLFVGDVKYKRDYGSGRDADLYQLLAYATATGLDQATLVYADGPPEAPTHTVRNTGITLNLCHLDLAQPPGTVLNQLSRVAIPGT